jgi:hypothetical protein
VLYVGHRGLYIGHTGCMGCTQPKAIVSSSSWSHLIGLATLDYLLGICLIRILLVGNMCYQTKT